MLHWLCTNGLRSSGVRYSVVVYVGLLLAGTLAAGPPAPPDPFLPPLGDAASRWQPAAHDLPDALITPPWR